VFFDGGVAAIWAFDANTAVGVGNTGLSCGFTQNGCVAAAVSGDLRAVWGPAPDFVIAVGAGGAIRHRVDGTWSEIASPTTVELTAVAGRSPTDAYAAGAGVVLRWDGVAWTVVQDAPLAPGDRVRAAFADADGTWFAVPSGLWRLTDAGWDASPWDVRDVLSISGTAADDVFAVSDEGVVHFDGQRWTPVRLPVPDATFVAVAASPRRVVFVGDDQYVLRR
jgi:hypothetical protein